MKSHESTAIALNSLQAITSTTRPISKPVHGWLAAVRKALGLSRAAVAASLKVTPSAVQDYEKAEKADAITLATLRRVAGAMDCELVVALVPKNGLTFAQLAARRDPNFAHLRATEHSMALEAQASNDLPPSPTAP
ncbi:helix-turn-helix domain-containing protein [Rariglobus hedericola]|uniref:helix-turn-helix domain-containing protein n=1 Tax=Rariglobus hedericola TaxID=2597822 RepID=UPI001396C5F9|nr:helix-turn-helix domain-containing protein [Rariglobus hedericola]